jgi:hypothetical protein
LDMAVSYVQLLWHVRNNRQEADGIRLSEAVRCSFPAARQWTIVGKTGGAPLNIANRYNAWDRGGHPAMRIVHALRS